MKGFIGAVFLIIGASIALALLLVFTQPQQLSPEQISSTRTVIPTPSISAEPYTIAFIGDSGYGKQFIAVLQLIKDEGADMVLHQGDFDYHSDPQGFVSVITSVLGKSFPYYVSVGNHDASKWPEYAQLFYDRMQVQRVTPDDADLTDEMYSVSLYDFKMVFVGQNGNNDAFASFIDNQFASDTHPWKICSWHKNQTDMQLGGKGNDMGWDVYETCRKYGAIVATGHEHSYSRTKTLVDFQDQLVDPDCPDPDTICLESGKSFSFVSGIAGHSIRNQDRCLPTTYPYGCNHEWASIYTSDQGAVFGALFITFNYQGDNSKAYGYFKDINGDIVDHFTITRS